MVSSISRCAVIRASAALAIASCWRKPVGRLVPRRIQPDQGIALLHDVAVPDQDLAAQCRPRGAGWSCGWIDRDDAIGHNARISIRAIADQPPSPTNVKIMIPPAIRSMMRQSVDAMGAGSSSMRSVLIAVRRSSCSRVRRR